MTGEIDYRAAFKRLPSPTALLAPDFVVLDANDPFLDASGRSLEDVVGHNILAVFAAEPSDPGDTGRHDLRASLETVVATGERDVIDLTRYDTEDPDQPGVFVERFWTIVNVPLCDADGKVTMIIHKADEVTHMVRQSRVVNS